VIFVAAALAIAGVFFTASRLDHASRAATSDSRSALKAAEIQASITEPMSTAGFTAFMFFISDTYRSLPPQEQAAIARELLRDPADASGSTGPSLASVAMSDRDLVKLARGLDHFSMEIDAFAADAHGLDVTSLLRARDTLSASIDAYFQEPTIANFRAMTVGFLAVGSSLKQLAAVLEDRLAGEQAAVERATQVSRIAVLICVVALTSIMIATTLFLGRVIQNSFAVATAEKETLRSTSEALRQRNIQLSSLYNVFAEITDTLSLRYVVQSTLREAIKLVNADMVVLRQLKGDELVPLGNLTFEGREIPGLKPVKQGEGLMGRVGRRGRSHRMDRNAQEQLGPSANPDRTVESGIIVPLIVGARVVGTLACWSRRPSAFNADDERVLEMMASQVATAIVAADTMDTSHRRAHQDPLTELPNRLQLHEDITGYLSLIADSGRSAAVAMADIDHFKELNDDFGHRVGDVTLQKIASVLRNATRPGDRVYRYGGEEFLFIFEDVEEAEAIAVADRVREAVAATPLTADNIEPIGPVTISIGLAILPDHGIDIEELIRFADSAMYSAKQTGRNRVVIWKEPVVVATSAAA
jgi:diguanylate cyclase (GGDEF)-like protein